MKKGPTISFSRVLLNDVAALLLGALLTLAFAPYDIFPLAIISPAGLLALWLNVSPKRAFWLGYLFGLGLFGTGVYWVFISIHTFGNVPSLPAGLLTAALIMFIALFPAVVGYFLTRYFPHTTTAKLVCVFPAIWVASEWVRSWIFTGFPWLFLGYSQTSSPLKGFAPILSVYGVSLVVLVTSALAVNAIIHFRQKKYSSIYFNLFALITLWVAGGLLNLIPWTHPDGDPISLSLVQGNIPQEIKWSPDHLELSLNRYEKLTEPLWGKDKVIIWPEAAIPVSLQEAAAYIETLDEKAKASGSSLILGIPIEALNGSGYYNAVVTLGETKKVYLKRHLVPFGEYIPFSSLSSRFFKFMDIPMSNLLPGQFSQDPLMTDRVKILASICYEIAFPELIKFHDRTIGLLLTVTNDAWFGKSSAQAQHLQMAQMRAIELRRPTIFVSNNGITAIINPDGKIESAAPTHTAYVLTATIQPMIGLTPWMRNGIDPILFILICLLVVAIRSSRNMRKAAEQIKCES